MTPRFWRLNVGALLLLLPLIHSTLAQTKPAPTIQDIDRRISLLEARVAGIQTRTPNAVAALNCNTATYSEFILSTGFMVLFAACLKAEPYLEGHKLTVQIGNPHTFSFGQLKGGVVYGKDYFQLKSEDFSVTDELKAGAWTVITIALSKAKTAEDLRIIHMSLGSEFAAPTRR